MTSLFLELLLAAILKRVGQGREEANSVLARLLWVDRPQNYKGLYGILQLSEGSYFNQFLLKILKPGWVAFHP